MLLWVAICLTCISLAVVLVAANAFRSEWRSVGGPTGHFLPINTAAWYLIANPTAYDSFARNVTTLLPPHHITNASRSTRKGRTHITCRCWGRTC
jgi:hypothetical protein